MDEQKVAELNRIIRECKHIVFFGGAGVSTESGIPDFRSKDFITSTMSSSTDTVRNIF